MDRRAFLKTSGVVIGALSSGGLLAACGESTGVPRVVEEGSAAEGTWNVINASFELLTGEEQRFAFALTSTEDNTPVEDAEVEVYTREAGSGAVIGGPFPVESFGATDVGLPLYRAVIDVPQAGPIEIVAVAGDDYGASAINAVDPEDSAVAVPGEEAVAVATPTEEDDLGLTALCTRQPACDMHEVSLEEALEQGRPVMLMFATPAYCQTAVCGPGVDTLQEIHESRDWGDVAFIHAEIFTDEGQTVADHVRAWDLPSEPWLFSIDGDGRIVRRLDGPMIAQELEELAGELA